MYRKIMHDALTVINVLFSAFVFRPVIRLLMLRHVIGMHVIKK